jgi:hypothetical protein
MHYFAAEIRQQEIGSVNAFASQAEAVYEENLNAYVKMVLRRPFSKIIVSHDVFQRQLGHISILTIFRITLTVSSNY